MSNKGIDPDRSGHIIVRPYIYDMQDVYAAADLVISRAELLVYLSLTFVVNQQY